MTCPAVVVAPGALGTTPALWGNQVTLSTTDLVGFGPTAGKVSLKCSDGRTLADALTLVSWLPQAIVFTLPARSAVATCDSPLFYELWVHIPAIPPINAMDCGPYTVDILSSITDPTQLDANDLTDLARKFLISVSVPGPGMVPETGVPVRAQVVPPLGTAIPFTDISGVALPRMRKWNPVIGGMRVEAMQLAAKAQRMKVPPLVLRSPVSVAALAKQRAHQSQPALQPAKSGLPISRRIPGDVLHGGVPTATLPPPVPSITVEVSWTITGFSLFGIGTITVQEGTLFTLADPNNPLNGVAPTLSSVLIGILFQPWVTPLTDPPTPARQAVLYLLNARIKLSVAQTQTASEWIDLQPVPLPVPVLEVPVVLALFSDANFTGHLLACVPSNSPLRALEAMTNKLKAIQDLLAPLQTIESVAAWLTGLGSLINKLPVSPGATALVVANDQGRIDLDSQVMEKGGTFGWDTDWEDQVSSMILFGPQGTAAAFFSAPDWSDDEGRYDIGVGFELSVSVRNLAINPTASIPAGALVIVKNSTDESFNDTLSTLQFI
jgi:hypothetical protein